MQSTDWALKVKELFEKQFPKGGPEAPARSLSQMEPILTCNVSVSLNGSFSKLPSKIHSRTRTGPCPHVPAVPKDLGTRFSDERSSKNQTKNLVGRWVPARGVQIRRGIWSGSLNSANHVCVCALLELNVEKLS